MAEIGANTGSSYPAAIDTNSSLEINGATKARAAVPNDLAAAIVAVQTALGTNPQGSAASLKARLAVAHNDDGTHQALVITLASYTQAGLPAAGTAGRLARVTDGIRGIWKDTGTAWVSITGYADVSDFGASPSASAATNTTAIQAAIDAVGSTSTVRSGRVVGHGVYSISSTLTIDRKAITFGGLGPGRTDDGGGFALKWAGSAGLPMVKVTRSWFLLIENMRFIGNSAAKPSAAIDLNVTTGDSPYNTRLAIRNVWIGSYGSFDTDNATQLTSGIVTSGDNVQNDQSSMDQVTIQGFSAYGIRLDDTQNTLWDISNSTINGADTNSVGISSASRHVVVRNPFFQTNLTDLELTNDGMMDVYNMGSEGSDRLALAAAGGQFRFRGGYWQAGANIISTGIVVDISGGASVLRMEDFLFTRAAGYSGPTEMAKMRGTSATAIFSNVSLQVSPENFFDLTTVTSGDRRRVEFHGQPGSPVNFINEWSHGESPDFNRQRTDVQGLTRLRQSSGQTPIFEVWTSNLGANLFKIESTGITVGDVITSLYAATFSDLTASGSLKGPVVATASLPAAGASMDGKYVIEDAGAGDRNLIIYAGGQRFRIDGGAAF